MLSSYINHINVTVYQKEKKCEKFSGICFSDFSYKVKVGYKAHYKINNNLIKNKKLIKNYLTIWNNWKPTKNWFDIDKIINDNGLVWYYHQGLHKVNTKICILRFIDEYPTLVTKITKHIDNYSPNTLIKVLLSNVGNGHSFVYNYKQNLTFKKDNKKYKEKRSMIGIHSAWDTSIVTRYQPLSAEERKILA